MGASYCAACEAGGCIACDMTGIVEDRDEPKGPISIGRKESRRSIEASINHDVMKNSTFKGPSGIDLEGWKWCLVRESLLRSAHAWESCTADGMGWSGGPLKSRDLYLARVEEQLLEMGAWGNPHYDQRHAVKLPPQVKE